jgi:biopolymer transport protein ExbB/TolQ
MAAVVLAWCWFLGLGLIVVGFAVWIPTANPTAMEVVWVGIKLLIPTTIGAIVAIPAIGIARLWKSKTDGQSA